MNNKINYKLLLKKVSPRLTLGYVLYDVLSPISWLSNLAAFISISAALILIFKNFTQRDTTRNFFEINTFTLCVFALIIFFGSPNERSILAKNIVQIKKVQTYLDLIHGKEKLILKATERIENPCFAEAGSSSEIIYEACSIPKAAIRSNENYPEKITFSKNENDDFSISGIEKLTKYDCFKYLDKLNRFLSSNDYSATKKLVVKSKDGFECLVTETQPKLFALSFRRIVIEE